MVLTREQFMENLKSKIGDDSSDEALKYLEDMTDTFNELEKKAQGNKKTDEDWKKEVEEVENKWRTKYRERFFNSDASGGSNDDPLVAPTKEEPKPEETITIDDLFDEKGSK